MRSDHISDTKMDTWALLRTEIRRDVLTASDQWVSGSMMSGSMINMEKRSSFGGGCIHDYYFSCEQNYIKEKCV